MDYLDRKELLDKGFVELIDAMGNDSDIVAAARVSYNRETKGKEKDKQLLEYLILLLYFE